MLAFKSRNLVEDLIQVCGQEKVTIFSNESFCYDMFCAFGDINNYTESSLSFSKHSMIDSVNGFCLATGVGEVELYFNNVLVGVIKTKSNVRTVFFNLLDFVNRNCSIDSLWSSAEIFKRFDIGPLQDYRSIQYLKEKKRIGGWGFGFVDRLIGSGKIHIPHLAGLFIGSGTYVGESSIVDSGILIPTIIGSNVQIDNNVHVGHNTFLGDRVVVVSGSVICGSVCIEEGAWIGPNSTILNGVRVGKDSYVGGGAVVAQDIPTGAKIIGVSGKRVPC